MHYIVFSGSARKGNFTQHVATLVAEVANKQPNITAEIISPTTYSLNFSDEGPSACPPELQQKVATADGYIIVSPEYNHGYSGSLKYLLDLNLKEYIHKPAAMVGVSKGPWGGTRVIEALLHPLREMGMIATFTDVNFTNVQQELLDGQFIDKDKWVKRIERMLEELQWMAQVLKSGREQVPNHYHNQK